MVVAAEFEMQQIMDVLLVDESQIQEKLVAKPFEGTV
jgi:hypothetical protein